VEIANKKDLKGGEREWKEKKAKPVAKRQKFTVGSWDTFGRCKTGMPENKKNLKTGETISWGRLFF